MAEPEVLDRLHGRVIRRFIETGHAPTYLDLARDEGMAPEAARQAVRELMPAVPGCWQHPGTDHIDGEEKWTAQCGFEALAVTHLFPGKEVTIDSVCRDCGEPVQVVMRDGAVVSVDPPEAVGHSNVPLAKWFDDFAVT
jgi:hypothetical protein